MNPNAYNTYIEAYVRQNGILMQTGQIKKEFFIIPAAKISPPSIDSLKNVIERPKPTEKILKNLHRKATLISAGAGAGKSVFLTRLIGSIDRDIYWINLDEKDNELLRFIYLILKAVRQKNPLSSDVLSRYMITMFNLEDNIELIGGLLADILASLPSFLLVIEDFHKVENNERISELMDRIVGLFPPDGHLIISNRRSFSFKNISLNRSRQWLNEIFDNDLILTKTDIKMLLSLRNVPQPHRLKANRLHQISRGYAGLIMLLLERMETISNPSEYLDNLLPGNDEMQISSYVLEETFNGFPQNLKDFVLTSSLFDPLIPDELNEILNRNDSHDLLEQLANNNLLTFKVSSQPLEYRYHDFLRTNAYNLLKKQTSNSHVQKLHRKAALMFRKKKNPSLSAEHFIKAGMLSEAADVFNGYSVNELKCFGINRLQNICAELPEENLKCLPDILLVKARALIRNDDLDQARKLIDRALDTFKNQNNVEGMLNAYALKGYSYQYTLQYDELTELCSKALEIAGDKVTKSSLFLETLQCLCPAAGCSISDKKRILEKNLKFALQTNDKLDYAKTSMDIVKLCHAEAGQNEIVVRQCESLAPIFEKFGRIDMLCDCLSTAGVAFRDMGRLNEAENKFEKVLELAVKYGSKPYWFESLYSLVLIALKKNMSAEAFSLLNRMKKRLSPRPFSRPKVLYLSGMQNYFKHTKEEASALFYADEYLRSAEQSGNDEYLGMALYAKARTTIDFHKNPAETEKRLLQSLDIFKKRENYLMVASIYYLLAVNCMNENAEPGLKKYMKKCLELTRMHGFHHIFTAGSGTRSSLILVRALEKDIETDYAAGLLLQLKNRKFLSELLAHKNQRIQKAALAALENLGKLDDLYPAIRHLASEGAPSVKKAANEILVRDRAESIKPLKIKCFGKFQVWIGDSDKPIENSMWVTAKAKSIFKYLLINRRKPVHKEVLIDIIWPDSDLKQGYNKLRNAIYYIKRALQPKLSSYAQSPYILNCDHHYTFLLPENSKVDYTMFENRIQSVKSALEQGDPVSGYRKFKDAAELFQGEFLSEDRYESWIEPYRTRFNLEFANTGLTLAEKALKAGFTHDALKVAELIHNIDPLNDDVVAVIMKAHAQSGHSSAAVAAYHQFAEFLRKELDCEPAEYLKQLYQSINSERAVLS